MNNNQFLGMTMRLILMRLFEVGGSTLNTDGAYAWGLDFTKERKGAKHKNSLVFILLRFLAEQYWPPQNPMSQIRYHDGMLHGIVRQKG